MADGLIILRKLGPKPRTILWDKQWEEMELSAFVGATNDETLAQFGIGLMDAKGECRFWGMLHPQALVTAWRGMYVLDRMEHIRHATICHSYYLGQRKVDHDVERALEDTKEQLPEIEKLREEVLQMKIPDEELDRMLKICNAEDNAILLATWELEAEVEAGTIHATDEVMRALEIAAAARVRQAQNEVRSQQPLPRHQSFVQFCKGARVKNVSDYPIGSYAWGMRGEDKIDEDIVYAGLQFGHGIDFVCSENSPPTGLERGRVGSPVVLLKDGRELVLKSVCYHDDQMWISAALVKSPDQPTEWKLSELAALGPQMVGIAVGRSDWATAEEVKRGYALIKRKNLPDWVSHILDAFKK